MRAPETKKPPAGGFFDGPGTRWDYQALPVL